MKSNYLQVLRTALNGISQRKTAKMYGVSRDTVSILVRYARSNGWVNSCDLGHLSEEDLRTALFVDPETGVKRDTSYEMPDYDYVHQELAKENVTLTLLWEEYVEKCLLEGKRYYKETQFRRYYHQFAKIHKCTIRLEHKPGYTLEVDWAGSTIAYYDEDLGRLSEAHLFVAVLPCSQLMYAEVFKDEKLPAWITAHTHCFQYFGGVPKTITPDNLKTGVNKPIFYEPLLNRTYQEMTEYYGTTVLPCRVEKPRDKGSVENSVRISSQRILGKLRNENFHNFFELQEKVKMALEAINERTLTGKNMSRWEAFLNEEKDDLLTLPTEPFELSEWGTAKVHPDSHIECQGHFYSVPFEYIGEEVETRITSGTVELFYHQRRIASHKREWGNKRNVTILEHMPPGKMFFVNWDAERFLSWGGQIGTACQKIIQAILDRSVIEQHAYRACFGVLSLKDKYTARRLEDACAFLLQRSITPSYSQVKRILERKEDLSGAAEKTENTNTKGFRRGADYYKR